jgi:hypothetical protein
MEKYIGTKQVMAQPMTADEAVAKGYKVGNHEHEDGYEVEYKDGYKSWSPKEVFKESYKLAESFTDRMYIELSELTEKTSKLYAFFETDIFKNLAITKQNLMRAQYGAMMAYKEILAERIRIEKQI